MALKADGTVVGWGWNGYGQTSIPASATSVVAIAAGGYFSLALKADGQVIGWGNNDQGQTTAPVDLNQLNLTMTVSGTVDAASPGSYLLTYGVTNPVGAAATASRTVIVADTLPPVLSLSGKQFSMIEVDSPFEDAGATAMDLCAGDLTSIIASNLTVVSGVPGTYTNTYSVTDPVGNVAQTNRVVIVVTWPTIAEAQKRDDGSIHFTYTNTPGAAFNVYASPDLALPLNQWTYVGSAVEQSPGSFEFTDEHASDYPARFYRLASP